MERACVGNGKMERDEAEAKKMGVK
ncbi:hypothetical protein CCACVL1_07483 [Corchorus capsularis]|uniref:Uncharacterized protein n=1 Tax=Corchorus capsularis TaxID=210143 RepID=A0A1R3J5U1_COCAP|nr:hypothetical protein CCACVL1_07483 [Corchorus capsularis]